MQTALWLRRARLLGAFAVTIWIVPVAGADEPPKPDAADDAEVAGDLGPASELVPEVKRQVRVIKDLIAEVQPEVKRRVRIATDLINDVETSGFRYPGKYTVRMSLTSVPKSLDSQLALNGKGALVRSVGKDGPADKAGLKVHDILVATGDTPVKKLSQVIETVNESDGKTITLKVLREGKPITVVITPEKSTGFVFDGKQFAEKRREAAEEAEKAASEAVRKAEIKVRELEKEIHERLKDAGVDVRMQLIQPGRIAPQEWFFGSTKTKDLPENLSVEIRKQGKQPAEIKVKQGDKSWSVTEDELDELPEEVRKHVKALLGRSGAFVITGPDGKKPTWTFSTGRKPAVRKYAQPAQPEARRARDRAADVRKRVQDRVERRLDEMSREMRRMRQRMEELRRSLRDDAEPGEQTEVEDRDSAEDNSGDEEEEDEDNDNR